MTQNLFCIFLRRQLFLKLEIIDLSAWYVLLDYFFAHLKYDLAAKKCPRKARGQNDHVT